jgi:hypothetical protein
LSIFIKRSLNKCFFFFYQLSIITDFDINTILIKKAVSEVISDWNSEQFNSKDMILKKELLWNNKADV